MAALALVTLLLASPARSQDAETPAGGEEFAPTPEDLGWVPAFRVVGFQDREGTGDCDRADARYGNCIEIVDFIPYELLVRQMPVWSDKESWQELLDKQEDNEGRRLQRDQRRASFAQWRAMSKLYARMWEDIVYRWTSGDDAAISTLLGAGYHVLPDAPKQWDLTSPGRSRVYSLPEHEQWLGSTDWLQPFRSQLPEEEKEEGPDSDADGISDVEEQNLGTYPNVADTDKDSWPDGEEVEAEASPLDPDDYPQIVRSDPFYRRVKYAVPAGQDVEPVPTAVLSGRFAVRLGVDGRLHDYDLMDADPGPSAPFFEQMFPYENIYQGVSADERQKYIPLVDFDRPETHLQSASFRENADPITDFGDTVRQAGTEFNNFYRLIGSQIAQFAMEDYTVNHMRILAALTLMRSPPGSKGGTGGLARNLVAAARKETDDPALLKSRMDNSVYQIQGGFSLRYDKLPETLLDEWIGRLTITHPPDDAFYSKLNRLVAQLLNDNIRRSADYITQLDDTYLEQWINANRSGGEPTTIRVQIKQVALQLLTEQLKQSERDRVETYLLLDHLDEQIFKGLDETKGAFAPPADIAGLTSDSWQGVLGTHDYSTNPIAMGLGAVDPTAICTTKDGVEALGQPSVGVVNLDILFSATDGLPPNDLLWEAREQIPFLMLDNPVVNDPAVDRMVGLPDGLALYRARWTVWSGWHFFWQVEPFARDDLRLVLRTGAVCEDTILANPDLVPTIVRAGLLEGNFRPTEAARIWDDPDRKERRQRRRQAENPDEAEDADRRLRDAELGLNTGRSAESDYEYYRDVAESPEETAADSLAQTGLGLFGKRKQKIEQINRVELEQTVQYFHGFVRRPLERISADENGLLVVVFDTTDPTPRYGLRDFRPRTPYARTQKRVGWGKWIRASNWAMFLDKDPEVITSTHIAPNYAETPSVDTDTIVPRWKRNKTWDGTFGGGVAFFPFRQVQYTCDDQQAVNYDVVNFCSPQNYEKLWMTDGYGLQDRTEGFGVDFYSMATWWFWDEPRIAWEMGLEARADFLHPGESWFWSPNNAVNGVAPDYSFAFRPQGGVIVGLRHAPDPYPLWRLWRRTPTWGADGPDGSSKQGRWEHGIRTGFLVGPGYNGMEATAVAELWRGVSLRRQYSPWQSFTPYHPIMLGNFYVRGQYGWTLIPDADQDRFLDMVNSFTLLTGVRIQFRLKEPVPELP